MDFRKAFTFPVLVSASVASGVAGVGGYAVHTVTAKQDVAAEVVVKIDEDKLSSKVAEKMIKHEQQLASAEDYKIKVRACKRNADNEYYVRDHCKGVTF